MAKEELDLDYLENLEELSAEPPILPYEEGKGKKHGQSTSIKYKGPGWTYYLATRSKFPEWWEEFNNKLGSDTSPKYKTIRSFIQAKTKVKRQQEWLYTMFGPKPIEYKLEVPWLGDWYKRRKNGYWNTETGFEYARLTRLINKNIESSDAIRSSAPFVIQDLVRITRLQEKVDAKFNGDPFLNGHPLSSGNKTRFKMYTKMHGTLIAMKRELIKDWMRVNGIDPNNPHQMHDMALVAQLSGGVGASAALAGFAAGQRALPSGDLATEKGIVITRDAALLAQHLTQSAATWKKPLPDIELNGDELVEKKSKKVKSDDRQEKAVQ
jgi:hypothetical protein